LSVLSFQTKQIRDVCESLIRAERSYGTIVAKNLQLRLADLQAADSIYDLPEGIITTIGSAYLVVDLEERYRMLLVANHTNNPLLESGDTDWSKVTRIKVSRIERV